MSDTIKVRVDKGARWLDQQYPGWHTSMNLVELDINNSDWCVLGQVYFRHLGDQDRERLLASVGLSDRYDMGGFPVMAMAHRLDVDMRDHGFVPLRLVMSSDVDQLNEEWIRQVISRLMGDITMENLEAQVPA